MIRDQLCFPNLWPIDTIRDKFDLTLKTYEELVEMFRIQNCDIPFDVILQAIENTNVMADSVTDFELDTSVKYPKLYDNEEEVLKKRIFDKLHEKIDAGIIKKKKIPEYVKRIKEEMRVFKKINMCNISRSRKSQPLIPRCSTGSALSASFPADL